MQPMRLSLVFLCLIAPNKEDKQGSSAAHESDKDVKSDKERGQRAGQRGRRRGGREGGFLTYVKEGINIKTGLI